MDTSKSTQLGKAYEYACLVAVQELISDVRPVKIVENSSFQVAKGCFTDTLSQNEQYNMITSARVGISSIIKLEPQLSEQGDDELEVLLQPDNIARDSGDIRDVLVIRRSIDWEVGISVKHNHDALKHSRLSSNIDFGQRWMSTPCSRRYFEEIEPIFSKLQDYQSRGLRWSELDNKEEDIYVPLLFKGIRFRISETSVN